MAIGTPVGIASVQTGTATSATVSATTTAAVTAGDSIIVAVATTSAARVLNSVTDSAGNTYTIDVTRSGGSNTLYMASCHNALALASGSTITATWATNLGGGSVRALHALTVSGLASAAAFDVGAGGTATSTAWSSGATATTAQADELAVGAAVLNLTSSSTPGGGYTELYDTPGSIRTTTSTYLVVSSTGAQTASGTWAASNAWVAAVATYKAAAPATTISPTGIASAEAFGTPTVTVGPAPQTITPSGIASAEAFGTPTVIPGAVIISPAGIVSGEAFGTPIVTVAGGTQFIIATGIASAEAFGTPTITVGPAPQTIIPTGIPSGEAFGSPLVLVAVPVVQVGLPVLAFDITTLHYPDAPAVPLCSLQQFTDGEVGVPWLDARDAKVTLSIYDQVFEHIERYTGSPNIDPYAFMLRATYGGVPVFWGPVTLCEWNGEDETVTLNAVDAAIRLQHHYLRIDDELDGVPMTGKGGTLRVSPDGLYDLIGAAENLPEQTARGVPDLGIGPGRQSAMLPSPVPEIEVSRGDELWSTWQQVEEHRLAPGFRLRTANYDEFPYYCWLDTFDMEPFAAPDDPLNPDKPADRSTTVLFHYGFGRLNLAGFRVAIGGKIVTHQHVLDSEQRLRVTRADAASSAYRGIYVAWENTDYTGRDKTKLKHALELWGDEQIRAYGSPPPVLTATLRAEEEIPDEAARYRFLRDYREGDVIHVEAKKGYMRESHDAQIRKVTLKQREGTRYADAQLDLVPNILAGAAGGEDA